MAKGVPNPNAGNRTGKRSARRLAPERISHVEQMLRGCLSHPAITAICAREWQISQRAVSNYINAVYEKWERENKRTLIDRVYLRRGQLEGVLELAMNPGKGDDGRPKERDLKVAIAALDRLCRVDGAYAAERQSVEVSGQVEQTHTVSVDHMTSEQKRQRIAYLIAKAKGEQKDG